MGGDTYLTKFGSFPEFLNEPLLMLVCAEQLESTDETESDLRKRPPVNNTCKTCNVANAGANLLINY